MSVRLERYVYLTLVTLVVALCTTILVASPAAAQAQEGTPPTNNDAQATNRDAAAAAGGGGGARVMVRAGDSLWSISEEHLGPNATAPQIASEVERIYALNRERIGPNPNLIFLGQVLTLPPVGESSVNQPSAAARPTRGATGSAADAGESGEVPGSASERVTLPDVAAVQPVPTARSLTPSEDSPGSSVASLLRSTRSVLSSATSALVVAALPEDTHAERRLLGWLLLALSFGTACVLAFLAARQWWRRRAKRGMGEGSVEEAYRANYAFFDPLSRHIEETSTSASGAPVANGQPSSTSGDGTPPAEGKRRIGTFTSSARRGRRRRESVRRRSRRARPLREGPVADAHNPNVRRHLRAAPGNAPRKRRRANEPRRSVITRELANASKAHGVEGGR